MPGWAARHAIPTVMKGTVQFARFQYYEDRRWQRTRHWIPVLCRQVNFEHQSVMSSISIHGLDFQCLPPEHMSLEISHQMMTRYGPGLCQAHKAIITKLVDCRPRLGSSADICRRDTDRLL